MNIMLKSLCVAGILTTAVAASVLIASYVPKRNSCPQYDNTSTLNANLSRHPRITASPLVSPTATQSLENFNNLDEDKYFDEFDEDENPDKFECPVCYDNLQKSSMSPFFKCKHLVCEECLFGMANACEQGWDDFRSNEAQGLQGGDIVHVHPPLQCPCCREPMA